MVKSYKRFEELPKGAFVWTGARWVPSTRRTGELTQTAINRLFEKHTVLKNGVVDPTATLAKVKSVLAPGFPTIQEMKKKYGSGLYKWDEKQGWVPNIAATKKLLAPQRKAYAEQRESELGKVAVAQRELAKTIGKVSRMTWNPTARQLRPGQRGYIPREKRRKVYEGYRVSKKKEVSRLRTEGKKLTRYGKGWERATPKDVFGF